MSPAGLFLLVAISPPFVFSYNIDTGHPIVFTDPEAGAPTNNFGYSLAFSTRRVSPPKLNLFVGAPNSTNHEGKVYRCTERINARPSCEALTISVASAPKEVKLTESRYVLITGKSTGLGASMAMGESTNLTVCAPYSVINSEDGKVMYVEDMRGFCYNVPNAIGNTLYRDNEPFMFNTRYPQNALINTIYGFSVDYATNKNSGRIDRIIGQPRLDKLDIKQGNVLKKTQSDIDEFDNLGYSVSSGYYFSKTKLIYVAGAPGWMRTGKFVYIDSMRELSVEGSVLGEYFGASLATGDFDHDGFDDLAVGAPHWGEVDFGRVYTFFGQKSGTFQRGPFLQGSTEYGQFGYTLASADLDRDGRSDLVVSAPWQESGVVYVYYGSSDFKSQDSSARIVQQIRPSKIARLPQVKRFGFALAHPVDVDDNGYSDLAIGAYKSGHAVVLRSRPVIRTEVDLKSNPRTLQNTTESFVVSVCLKYEGTRAPETQGFEFKMIVDEDHKRVKDGSVKIFNGIFKHNVYSCKNQTIKLTQGNFLDPILVKVTYSIKENTATTEFCPSCPVLDRKNFGESKIMKVPFNTGCRQEKCYSSLSVTANLGGDSEYHEWVVGSGDLNLNVDLKNNGEPAHQTQLIIDIPARIRLRNVISFCTEKKNDTKNAVTLVCDIDKPIGTGETKSLSIILDMGMIFDSVGGSELIFNITRRTRSEDNGQGPNPTVVTLRIKNVAYITLTGLADSENIDYRRTEDKSNVRIRHSYQVLKKGETPITEAELTINVPVSKSGKNNTFLTVNSTKFTDSSGNFHKCFIGSNGDEIGNFSPLALPDDDHILVQTRRRRDVPADGEQERMENEPETAVDQTTNQTVYLNCSSGEYTCVQVICQFKLVKTSDDIGNMVLDIDFDANAFYTSNEDSLTVKFNTNASVKIITPIELDPTYLRNTTADVSTMLYNIPEPQKLAGWILPVSIFLGILLFCILALVLFKLGFFNRSQKLANAKAMDKELILNTGGNIKEHDEEDERFG